MLFLRHFLPEAAGMCRMHVALNYLWLHGGVLNRSACV